MKIVRLLLVPALLLSLQTMAQKKTSSDGKVGDAINKVGNKTAEIAVKGAATVADKKYDDKVGPGGQTIYIDGKSRYFYINDRGKRVYVDKKNLKDKPKK